MNSFNKFLKLFPILVVLAALVLSFPHQRAGVIFVTYPDRYKIPIGSKQVVEWFCLTCKSNDNVTIEVLKVSRHGHDVVFKTTAKKAKHGSEIFEIDKNWAHVARIYSVRVSDQRDPNIVGLSTPFTVYPTSLPKLPEKINLPFHHH